QWHCEQESSGHSVADERAFRAAGMAVVYAKGSVATPLTPSEPDASPLNLVNFVRGEENRLRERLEKVLIRLCILDRPPVVLGVCSHQQLRCSPFPGGDSHSQSIPV